ncbi:hypothetical protein SAMN04515624_105117 [Eubacterium maltosivorans]|uniref:hypothetical protein n=1 Tax=Eubacterium maltosivorans TaxID=2041044 RepID=UPI000883FB76|nr:hypothetical protein [Eubacterium maltosivorans]WPK79802.1 hypothetical protein EUMA32_12110 [Eubacterium maltosivorans]SDP01016.1 hypothetical protein SAMN04515624_105117 [Eubacterium maltosivorans]
MAFKGKSTIELRNAETGKLEFKTEDENMVTNAAYNLMNSNRWSHVLYDDLLSPRKKFAPLLNSCFKGCLLFENSISENINEIIPPLTNTTGIAMDSYTDTNPLRGSLNRSESKAINDGKGYRYVWDFATDKGNGIIRSVCLTSYTGGNSIPYRKELALVNEGTASYFTEPGYGIMTNTPYSSANYTSDPKDVFFNVTEFKDCTILAHINEKVFICVKCAIGSNTATFKKIELLNSVNLKNTTTYTTTEKIVTSNKKMAHQTNFYCDNGKVYSIYPYDNNTFDVVVLNVNTLEIEKEDTIVVQDGLFRPAQGVRKLNPVYYKGYYYLNKKDTYEYYKINEQDPSDYELSFLADIQYYDYSWKIAQPCLNIFNGVIMITGAINIYESVRIGFWDGECYYNSYFRSDSGRGRRIIPSDTVKAPFVLQTLDDLAGVRIAIVTPFLSTINNLSTPVVKNETQTMKVTYEITEI